MRKRYVIVAGAVAANLLWISVGSAEQASTDEALTDAELTVRLLKESGGEPLVFDEKTAEAYGYSHVLVGDKLPTCPDPDGFEGFQSLDQLESAVKEADGKSECGPKDQRLTFVIGQPAPTANHSTSPYHHNGQQTTTFDYRGGKGSFLVKDISDLGHPGSGTQFVVDRILVKRSATASACSDPNTTVRWGEAGWSEVSWRTNQRVIYTWSTTDCAWRFYPAFDLNDGNYYAWRVRHNDNGEMRTAVLWNDTWTVLTDYSGPDCVGPNGNSLCATEAYVEVYTAVSGNHPSWNGKIHDDALALFRDGGNWGAWTGQDPTAVGGVNPYTRCPEGSYSHFSVVSAGTSC